MKLIPMLLLPISIAFGAQPTQYVTHLYTELFGRAPDQSGYTGWINYIGNTTNLVKLKSATKAFVTGSEFISLNYLDVQCAVTLYRAILFRDPENATVVSNMAAYINQHGVDGAVEFLMSSPEFANDILNQAFSGYPIRWRSLVAPPSIISQLPLSGDAGCTTRLSQAASESDLRIALNGAQGVGTGTVCMNQSEVITLNSSITIPAGVTLRTVGSPGQNAYAKFGHLVRGNVSGADWAMVILDSGAKLQGIWLDGQESVLGRSACCESNNIYSKDHGIKINGGVNTTVTGSRISDSPANTNILVLGGGFGLPSATNVTITNNLITAYTAVHGSPPISDNVYSDGITILCDNAIVSGNSVIDASDMGIILFRSEDGIQKSSVTNNIIINTGNSGNAALMVDQYLDGKPEYDFTGAKIANNLVWTGANNHVDIILCVGNRPWFSTNLRRIKGISVQNNNSGIGVAKCNVGIFVGDLTNATVLNNVFNAVLSSTSVGSADTPLPIKKILGAVGTITGGTIQSTVEYQPLNLISGLGSHYF